MLACVNSLAVSPGGSGTTRFSTCPSAPTRMAIAVCASSRTNSICFNTISAFEAITLVQTHKVRSFPIVLVGTTFWSGLREWIGNTLEAEGMISPGDLDLMPVVDTAEEAVEALKAGLNRLYEAENGIGNGS